MTQSVVSGSRVSVSTLDRLGTSVSWITLAFKLVDVRPLRARATASAALLQSNQTRHACAYNMARR